MVEHYDSVCSCCYNQGIDPAYNICEKCRRKIQDLINKETMQSKEIVTERKENEVLDGSIS